MKILITGGTGFIGSQLALRCQQDGHRVCVLGREDANPTEIGNQKFLADNGVEILLGSVVDRDRMFSVTESVDIVFHLAAAQHEMNISDDIFRQVNVEGTRNILDASVSAGVKRFVHGSTIGVYDKDSVDAVDESTLLRPDNIYGVTKLEGEEVVASYFENIPSVIVRISETYGPGDRRLLKLFRMIQKGRFFMIGGGKNIHQLIYIDDLVQGLLMASIETEAIGEVLLLAGTERLTSNEMAQSIADAIDVRGPSLRVPVWPFLTLAIILETLLRPLGIQPPLHRRRMDFFTKSFQISTDKAEAVLDFYAETNFLRGAKQTAKWYSENGLL